MKRTATLLVLVISVSIFVGLAPGCAAEPPIIGPGHTMLGKLDLTPFVAIYDNFDRKSNRLGEITTEVQTAKHHGETVGWWVCSIETPKGTVVDSIAFDPESMAPRYRSFPHSKKGYHHLTIEKERVSGFVQPLDGGEAQDISVKFDRPVFEASLLDLVIAALPLEEGFTAKLPCADYQRGQVNWATVVVGEREEVANGRHAWRVDVSFSNGGKRILWITSEQPFRVRSDGGWNWRLKEVRS